MALRRQRFAPQRVREGDSSKLTRGEAATLKEDDATNSASPTGSGEKLKADIDDLLDEIDEVLESNAEDFVRAYIQKGGE